MVSAWDNAADEFNTYKEATWWGAADNIATVWPVFLNYIKENFPQASGRALEFGCGTGMFCKELKKLGFYVAGVDISPEMIKIGLKNLEPNIKLMIGDTATADTLAKQDGKFNLVTSIMVLQFVETKKLAELAASIENNGHVIFANHNPLQLEARGVKDKFYVGPDKVPVLIYKRNSEDYDKIFLSLGFKKTFEILVQTPEEIRRKYNINYLADIRKYLILAYQKI